MVERRHLFLSVLSVSCAGGMGVLFGILRDIHKGTLTQKEIAWKAVRSGVALAIVVPILWHFLPLIEKSEQKEKVILFCNRVGSPLAEDSECYICMNAISNSILKPCAHGRVCVGCALKVSKCPICRSTVENVLFWRLD